MVSAGPMIRSFAWTKPGSAVSEVRCSEIGLKGRDGSSKGVDGADQKVEECELLPIVTVLPRRPSSNRAFEGG